MWFGGQTWQPWLIDGPQYGPFLTRLDVGKKVLVLHAAARFDPLLHEVFHRYKGGVGA